MNLAALGPPMDSREPETIQAEQEPPRESSAEKEEYKNPLQGPDSDGQQEETIEKTDRKDDDKAMFLNETRTREVLHEGDVNQMKGMNVIKECLGKLARIFYPNLPPDAERRLKVEETEQTSQRSPILEKSEEIKEITEQDKDDNTINNSESETKSKIDSLVENIYKELVNEIENAEILHFNENLKLLWKCIEKLVKAFYPFLVDLHEKSPKTTSNEAKTSDDVKNMKKFPSQEKSEGSHEIDEETSKVGAEEISERLTDQPALVEDVIVPSATDEQVNDQAEATKGAAGLASNEEDTDQEPVEPAAVDVTVPPTRVGPDRTLGYKPPLECLIYLIDHFYPEYSGYLYSLASVFMDE